MTTETTTLEVRLVNRCEGCEETVEDDQLENQYECGSCGEEFTRSSSANDNHQCPSCYKFGGLTGEKVTDCCEETVVEKLVYDCPECGSEHLICPA